MDKDLTYVFLVEVQLCRSSSSQTRTKRGGDRIRTGETNPGLLILLFSYPLKGDGYRALGEGTAVGEQGRWTALQLGLASAWS